MGRGLKPSKSILNNWVNRLQKENVGLKEKNTGLQQKLQLTATMGGLMTRILKEKNGYSEKNINEAMVEMAGES